jgi:hypothetical protein
MKNSSRFILVALVPTMIFMMSFSDWAHAQNSEIPGFELIEAVTVPVDGRPVTSNNSLALGKAYKLRASGTFPVGGPGDGLADAEYANFRNPPASLLNHCSDGSGVDLGLGIDDSVNDGSKTPSWGSFEPTHVYVVEFVGKGAPIKINYHDCFSEDNSGSLKVEIFGPSSELVPPTVEFDLVREEYFKGDPYILFARATNNSSERIRVVIDWDERYTFPQPAEPAKEGSRSFSLEPNETFTINLESFKHSWEWIPKDTGPILKKLDLTLKTIKQMLENELTDEKLKDIVGHANRLDKLLSYATKLIDPILTSDRSTKIIYTGRVRYDRADVAEPARRGLPLLKELTLKVSPDQMVLLGGYLVTGGFAQFHTGAAIAANVFLPISVTNMLIQISELEAANKFFYEQAFDPPDPNFTEIAVPEVLSIPELEDIPPSIWKDLANSSLRIRALKIAESISLNRAAGARNVGEHQWESIQQAAAGRYAMEALRLQMYMQNAIRLVEPYIVNTLSPRANDVVRFLEQEGLPELEVFYLRKLGWSETQMKDLHESLMNLGTLPLNNTDAILAAYKLSTITSLHFAVEAFSKAARIQVEELGKHPTDLTEAERQSLNIKRSAIITRLVDKIPSRELFDLSEEFLSDVTDLLEKTNNFSELSEDLEFGIGALAAAQALENTLEGLGNFIPQLEQSGEILHQGIARSLQAKVDAAQEKLTQGHFENVRRLLSAFIHEVRAQSGKKIMVESANHLVEYASYLRNILEHEGKRE